MSEVLANPIGIAFAGAYGVYTLALLVATPVHLLVLLVLTYKVVRRRPLGRWVHLVIDLIYGLANPVLYLLVLERLAVRSPSPSLTALGSTVLVVFWALRLFGPAFPGRPEIRTVARGVLALSMATVASFLARDLSLGEGISEFSLLLFTPLYLAPILSAALHLAGTSEPTWERASLLLSWSRPVRLLGAVASALLLLSTFVAHWRPSAAAAKSLVLQHRAAIQLAAEKYGIEPSALAALVYVTHREHSNPFRLTLEEAAMTAWLKDKKSHEGLSRGLDVSIGLAQIKPVTALTAMALRARCAGAQVGPSKEFRDLPPVYRANPIAPQACVIARDARGEFVEAPLANGSGKDSVAAALLDPAKNLEFAAFILSTYATQWERAPGAAVIRNRPDILATLYQIGFERSHPKPNPAANEFGRQVLAAADETWIRESFASADTPDKEPE